MVVHPTTINTEQNIRISDRVIPPSLGGSYTLGMKHYVGEYWATTVEGYLMDMEGFKNSHDTHEWIKENDPELYDLIVRYFPT